MEVGGLIFSLPAAGTLVTQGLTEGYVVTASV